MITAKEAAAGSQEVVSKKAKEEMTKQAIKEAARKKAIPVMVAKELDMYNRLICEAVRDGRRQVAPFHSDDEEVSKQVQERLQELGYHIDHHLAKFSDDSDERLVTVVSW